MSKRPPVMSGQNRSPLRYPDEFPHLATLLKMVEERGLLRHSSSVHRFAEETAQEWVKLRKDTLGRVAEERGWGDPSEDRLLASVLADAAETFGRRLRKRILDHYFGCVQENHRPARGAPKIASDVEDAVWAVAKECLRPGLSWNAAYRDAARSLGPGIGPDVVRRACEKAKARLWIFQAMTCDPDAFPAEEQWLRNAYALTNVRYQYGLRSAAAEFLKRRRSRK